MTSFTKYTYPAPPLFYVIESVWSLFFWSTHLYIQQDRCVTHTFYLYLGGGNANVFLFSPRNLGKKITHPFWRLGIFHMGWLKPPYLADHQPSFPPFQPVFRGGGVAVGWGWVGWEKDPILRTIPTRSFAAEPQCLGVKFWREPRGSFSWGSLRKSMIYRYKQIGTYFLFKWRYYELNQHFEDAWKYLRVTKWILAVLVEKSSPLKSWWCIVIQEIGYVWAGLVRKSLPQISFIQVKES